MTSNNASRLSAELQAAREKIAALEEVRQYRLAACAEAERQRDVARAEVEKLRAALEEILNYQGGAETALDDSYVIERAIAALAASPERRDEGDPPPSSP